MKVAILSLLTWSALGQTPAAPKDVPTDLSNDYFAAYAEMGSIQGMLARSDAEMRAAYAAMQAYCKGDVIMSPTNKRRFACKPADTKPEPAAAATPPEPVKK
jgi:hypothetical protein